MQRKIGSNKSNKFQKITFSDEFRHAVHVNDAEHRNDNKTYCDYIYKIFVSKGNGVREKNLYSYY